MRQCQGLTSQIQELQERMNCLSDSGEFQKVEPTFSGKFSHVPSQQAVVPSPRSMLRPRQTLASWHMDSVWIAGKRFFVNPRSTLESLQTPCQGILHSTTSATGAVPVSDHPELPLPEEGQSRGTESPERGPVSARKTGRLHDLRLLSSDWRSCYSIGLFWFSLCFSGIRNKMGWSSIYYQCQRCPPTISWKVYTNWEYVSLRNSKPYWNCTTWRFIRRHRCPSIKSWRQWSRGV